MTDIASAVRAILCPTEELIVAFEAVLLSADPSEHGDDLEDAENTRVLAVVSHTDDWNSRKEGRYVISSHECMRDWAYHYNHRSLQHDS